MKVFSLFGEILIDDKATESITRIGKTLDDIVGKLTLAGIAAATAFAAFSTNEAIKFEKEMANVATLLSGSSESVATRMEELGVQVLQLSKDVGTSTTNLTQGLYQTVSALGDTSDSLEILEVATKGATAGGSSVEEAISLLSLTMKGYNNISAESAKKTSDLAFTTAKLGVTTFPELARSMGKVIPLAATLKINQEELFGAMATLTGVTGNTSEVSTQLSAVMKEMLKPGDALTEALKKMGFSSGAAALESKGLKGTLDILKQSVNGNSVEFGKLWSSSEAMNASLALTGNQAEDFTTKTKAMYQAVGATNEAFKTQSATTAQAIERMKASFNAFSIELGTKALPILNSFIDYIEEKMPEIQRNITVAFNVGLVAIQAFFKAFQILQENMHIILPILGGLTASFVAFKTALMISDTITLVKNAMIGFNAVMAANPVGAVSLAIGVLVAAGIALYQNWDFVVFNMSKLWNSWKNNTLEVIEVVVVAFNALKTGVKQVVINIVNAITETLDGTLSTVNSFIDTLNKTFGLKMSKATFSGIAKNITDGIAEGIEKDNKATEATVKMFSEMKTASEKALKELELIQKKGKEQLTEITKQETKKQTEAIKIETKEQTTIITEEITKQETAIKEATIENEQAQTSYLSNIYNKIAENASKVKAIFDTEEKEAETRREEDKTAFTNYLSFIAQATSDNSNNIVKINKDEKTQQEKDNKDYEEKYKQYYSNLTETAKQAIKEKEAEEKKAQEETEKNLKKQEQSWKSFLAVISEKIGAGYAKIAEGIKEISKEGEKSAEDLAGAINTILQGIGDATKESYKELGDFIKATGALIEAGVLAFSGNYIDALLALVKELDSIVATFQNIWDWITGKTKDNSEEIAREAEKMARGTINSIQAIFTASSDFLKQGLDVYGETAKGYLETISTTAEFVTKELKEKIQDGVRVGSDAWEKLKETAKTSFSEIEALTVKMTNIAISEANKLGTALITALKARHEEEEKAELKVSETKIQTAQSYFDKMKGLYDADLIARLASIDDEFRETLEAKNAQLTEEEKTINFITEKRKNQAFEEEKRKKEDAVLTATTEEEKQKAWEDYALLLANRKKEEITKEIKDVVASKERKIEEAKQEYNTKIELVKQSTDAIIAEGTREIEANKAKWQKIKEDTDYEQEAIKLATAENQDETIALLETYNPKWQDTGRSFGEKLVLGFNSATSTMQTTIQSILSWVGNAQRAIAGVKTAQEEANALIINSESRNKINPGIIIDNAEAKAGGMDFRQTETSSARQITQNIIVNSPKELDAVEIARQTRNMTAAILA